ncbi:APC family permease [Streptomyces sp. NP160]|nr:APC family permease [Streptomyces sp. NP160]
MRARGLSGKGLGVGTVGLVGAVVIGLSSIAPAYTMTAALGPTVSEVGQQVPALVLVGFLPMLLVALGYRELNRAMPDSGTTFTWATRAFGPWVGWMAGWGLVAATVLVLSNLAGIAVDFLFLLLAQVTGSAGLADLASNTAVNVLVCLAFVAAATAVAYRDMQTTQRVQLVMVAFQLAVLVLFAGVALWRATHGEQGSAQVALDWFDPTAVSSTSAFAAGLSLSIFIFWGWDVTLTMNEETADPDRTPGRAAMVTVAVIVAVYLLLAVCLLAFAGTGDTGHGLNNPELQDNAFSALAGPVLGPAAALVSLAVLTSSAASLQSTFVSPARTLLAMGHYGALPAWFGRVHPRFATPGNATVAAAAVAAAFYAVMRVVSENVLWDTITALGMMICFYYGTTAFACVWYFRRQWSASARSALFTLVCPLVGGLVLAVLFVTTLVDSTDPAYGSGSSVGGVGLVFVLGVGVIAVGAVLMVAQRLARPAFFRSETLRRSDSTSDTTADATSGSTADLTDREHA